MPVIKPSLLWVSYTSNCFYSDLCSSLGPFEQICINLLEGKFIPRETRHEGLDWSLNETVPGECGGDVVS